MKKLLTIAMIVCASVGMTVAHSAVADTTKPAKAAKGKVFGEMEFLHAFTGKSRQQVTDVLGKPERREQSVKPSGADDMISSVGKPKAVNVEMWYYSNIVEYAKKKTYKTTELTFVNDRCANVAFFNTK